MRHRRLNKKSYVSEDGVKIVHGFKYWWNVEKQQWEGLINNAKPFLNKRPNTKFEWEKYYDSL